MSIAPYVRFEEYSRFSQIRSHIITRDLTNYYCYVPYTDIVHITEKGASELKKIDEKLDIPLSYKADAVTASVLMKHSLKVRNRTRLCW